MNSVVPYAFMGGFRSGTTLLINLLTLHPELSTWFETKFWVEALRWQRVLNQPKTEYFESNLVFPASIPGFSAQSVKRRILTDITDTQGRIEGLLASSKAEHEYFPLGADRINYSLANVNPIIEQWTAESMDNIVNANQLLFNRLATIQNSQQCPVIVNKTPELPRFANELRHCFGEIKIIHLIRNGWDVVNSAYQLGWGEPAELAWMWQQLIIEARQVAQSAPQCYLEVRYEDLTCQPVSTLNTVCSFLGVSNLGQKLVDTYELDQQVKIQFKTGSHNSYPWSTQVKNIVGDLLVELGY